jgi:hypothetical protein
MITELLNGIILLSPVEGWEAVVYAFSLLPPAAHTSLSPTTGTGSNSVSFRKYSGATGGRTRWYPLLRPIINLSSGEEVEPTEAEEAFSLLITIASHAPTVEERVILRQEMARAGLAEALQVRVFSYRRLLRFESSHLTWFEQKLKYLPQCSDELKRSCEIWVEDEKDDETTFKEIIIETFDLNEHKSSKLPVLNETQLEELQALKDSVTKLTAEVIFVVHVLRHTCWL